MNYLYNSNYPLTGFSQLDCLVSNQTLLTIYKEQLRKEGGKELTISSYILELDNDYKRLESKSDNYLKAQWINLNLNQLLLVTQQDTYFLEFDDKLELLEYLGSRWKINDYLFIDCKDYIIEYQELKQSLQLLESKRQNRQEEIIEDYLSCEVDEFCYE